MDLRKMYDRLIIGDPPIGRGSHDSFIINGVISVQNEVYIYDTTSDSQLFGTGTLQTVDVNGTFTNLERDFSDDDNTSCGDGSTYTGVILRYLWSYCTSISKSRAVLLCLHGPRQLKLTAKDSMYNPV